MARNSSPLLHHVSPTRPCRPLFSRFQLYVKLLSALRELWVSVVLTRLESVKFSSDFWGEFDLFFPVDLDFLGASEERCSEISFPSFSRVVLRRPALKRIHACRRKSRPRLWTILVSLCKSPIKADWFVWPCSNQRQRASVSVTLSLGLPFKWGLIYNPGCGNGNEESIGDYEA